MPAVSELRARIEQNGLRHLSQLQSFANGFIEEDELCADDRIIVSHIRNGIDAKTLCSEIDLVENGGHLED